MSLRILTTKTIDLAPPLGKLIDKTYHTLTPALADYNGNIYGKFMIVTSVQYYLVREYSRSDCPGDLGVEQVPGEYVFSIDHNSAFLSLNIETPHGEIKGVVKAKDSVSEEGEQIYYMEDKTDPDIYAFRMGNLIAGESIKVTFKYITQLRSESNFSCVEIPLPTGTYPLEAFFTIRGIVSTIKDLPEGAVVTPDRNNTYVKFSKDVADNLAFKFEHVEMGFAYRFPYKNHDFVIVNTNITTAPPVPKQTVFCVDPTGLAYDGFYMNGIKKALIKCLETLEDCFFSIVVFGPQVKCLSMKLLEPNQETINTAIAFVERICNSGEVNFKKGLEAALSLAPVAILITNGGYRQHDDDIYELCSQFASLSVLGTGDVINHDNVKRMASFGHGEYVFASYHDGMCQGMDHLLEVSNVKVMRNVKATLTDVIAHQAVLADSGDSQRIVHINKLCTRYPLILGKTYEFYAVDAWPFDRFLLAFSAEEGFMECTLQLESLSEPELMDLVPLMVKRVMQSNKQDAAQLAVDFGILSSYTSLVADKPAKYVLWKPSMGIVPDDSVKRAIKNNAKYFRPATRRFNAPEFIPRVGDLAIRPFVPQIKPSL